MKVRIMGGESAFEPVPASPLEARIALDQIETLFGTVTVSVCGAAIAAGVLVETLHWLGAVDPWTGTVWTCWIVLCAMLHILLCRAYRQKPPAIGSRHRWAQWFTVICLAEGIGWGWASIGLVNAAHADVLHLVFLIAGGVAAAPSPFSAHICRLSVPFFYRPRWPRSVPVSYPQIWCSGPPFRPCSFSLAPWAWWA